MAKLDWIREELKELKEKGLYVTIRKLESAQAPPGSSSMESAFLTCAPTTTSAWPPIRR